MTRKRYYFHKLYNLEKTTELDKLSLINEPAEIPSDQSPSETKINAALEVMKNSKSPGGNSITSDPLN